MQGSGKHVMGRELGGSEGMREPQAHAKYLSILSPPLGPGSLHREELDSTTFTLATGRGHRKAVGGEGEPQELVNPKVLPAF